MFSQQYVGINLECDKRALDTSVPGFAKSKLEQSQHPTPSKPQHSPSKVEPIQCGQKIQKATPMDTSPKLSKEGI